MPPLSRRAFVRALGGLSRREFAAFVAALWSARGFETTVVGDVVVAERAGDRRRLGIRHGAGWLARFAPGPSAESVDAIVTSGLVGDSGPARIIDAGELREMALYAIDRAECERLFRRHLGRSPAATAEDARLPLTAAEAVAVVAVALLVTAGGFLGPASPPANATTEVDVTTTPPVATTPEDAATPAPEVSGFESADRLAQAHARAVDGRSRYWSLTFMAYRNGNLVKQKRQSVWLGNATAYRSHTEWWSREGIGPAYRGNATTYVDGAVAYERFREGNATLYSRLSTDGRSPPFADGPPALVRRYLGLGGPRLVTTTQVDGALGYRLVARGTLSGNSTNATTTAELTRSGVVRHLRTEYRSFGGLTIVVTFRLDGVGATTVSAPPWLERARNETGR